MKHNINRYKIHRLAGLVFLPFLFISIITGFFRANHQWFWKEDYKKIKNFALGSNIRLPQIGIDSIFMILKSVCGDSVHVSKAILKNEAGTLLYDIKIANHAPVLIDADSGMLLSPLSKNLATAIAGQYVKPGLKLKAIYEDDSYMTRKDKKTRPVYVAEYDDRLHTKIYIDKHTGEIVEESDDNLKIGFWMIKLHNFDWWELKRFNLSFVSIGLLLIGLSGFYIWLKKTKRKFNF